MTHAVGLVIVFLRLPLAEQNRSYPADSAPIDRTLPVLIDNKRTRFLNWLRNLQAHGHVLAPAAYMTHVERSNPPRVGK